MTLDDYITHLQDVRKQNPSFGKLTVVYAEDDEGNGYQKVENAPALFAVVDLESRHLEPDMKVLEKTHKGEEVKASELNCVIVN